LHDIDRPLIVPVAMLEYEDICDIDQPSSVDHFRTYEDMCDVNWPSIVQVVISSNIMKIYTIE